MRAELLSMPELLSRKRIRQVDLTYSVIASLHATQRLAVLLTSITLVSALFRCIRQATAACVAQVCLLRITVRPLLCWEELQRSVPLVRVVSIPQRLRDGKVRRFLIRHAAWQQQST